MVARRGHVKDWKVSRTHLCLVTSAPTETYVHQVSGVVLLGLSRTHALLLGLWVVWRQTCPPHPALLDECPSQRGGVAADACMQDDKADLVSALRKEGVTLMPSLEPTTLSAAPMRVGARQMGRAIDRAGNPHGYVLHANQKVELADFYDEFGGSVLAGSTFTVDVAVTLNSGVGDDVWLLGAHPSLGHLARSPTFTENWNVESYPMCLDLGGPGRDHGGLTFTANGDGVRVGNAWLTKVKGYPGPWVHTVKAAVHGDKGQKKTFKSFRKQKEHFANGVQHIRDDQDGASAADVGGIRLEFRCVARGRLSGHAGC